MLVCIPLLYLPIQTVPALGHGNAVLHSNEFNDFRVVPASTKCSSLHLLRAQNLFAASQVWDIPSPSVEHNAQILQPYPHGISPCKGQQHAEVPAQALKR